MLNRGRMPLPTRLATGLADLALLEQAPDHPDILVQKWLDDELLLVCGPGHALWGSGLVPLAELGQLRYVLREPNFSMRIILCILSLCVALRSPRCR